MAALNRAWSQLIFKHFSWHRFPDKLYQHSPSFFSAFISKFSNLGGIHLHQLDIQHMRLMELADLLATASSITVRVNSSEELEELPATPQILKRVSCLDALFCTISHEIIHLIPPLHELSCSVPISFTAEWLPHSLRVLRLRFMEPALTPPPPYSFSSLT